MSAALLCSRSLRAPRSALLRLLSSSARSATPSPASLSIPSSSSSPPESPVDRKAALHEQELVHEASFAQSPASLSEYGRVREAELRPLLRPVEDVRYHSAQRWPYRYDVGHELRFDTLHPPVLPHLDEREVGSGDYDRLWETEQLDPTRLADPTNRTWTYSLRFLEDAGYVTAARASAMVFASTLAPAADALAQGTVEVDTSHVAEGVTRTVKWRGKPVFVRHRTAAEILQARKDDELARAGLLRDPQLDCERVQREDWLVVVGICTHLGCVPLSAAGDYHGFFCPCHGSHYDTSARIRKGPAPLNLEVPPHAFTGHGKLVLGRT